MWPVGKEEDVRKTLVVAVMVVLLAAVGLAADDPAIAKAEQAAKTWLALSDAGDYAKSWDEASSLFRASVSKADWERMLKAARGPLGAVKTRAVKTATFTRTLPGAPDGEYVVIQFESSFANKASAVETVTPMHEKDGSWRVSGYFIR